MKTKLLTFLILAIGLISCNSKATKHQSNDLYNQGVTEMSRINLDSLDNDYSTAIKFFSETIDLDSKNFAAQYWKMYCEMRMNKLDNARMTFKKAIKNGLNDTNKLAPEFYVSAGLIDKMNKINSTKNFDKADKIFSSRVKRDKNNIDAIANKAILYCYLDKKNEAIAYIDLMISKVDSSSILID